MDLVTPSGSQTPFPINGVLSKFGQRKIVIAENVTFADSPFSNSYDF